MTKLRTFLVGAAAGLAVASIAASAQAKTVVIKLTPPPVKAGDVLSGTVDYSKNETLKFTYTIPAPDKYKFTDTVVLTLPGDLPPLDIPGTQTGGSGAAVTVIGPLPYSGTVTYTLDVLGVPEAASWALMVVGVGGVGAMVRRRRTAVAAA